MSNWTSSEQGAVVGTEVRFRTETGSVYTVDNERLTWRRVHRTTRSGRLRTESGELTAPVVPRVGESATLVGPPFRLGVGPRLIVTTPVVAVLPRPRAARHSQSGSSVRAR